MRRERPERPQRPVHDERRAFGRALRHECRMGVDGPRRGIFFPRTGEVLSFARFLSLPPDRPSGRPGHMEDARL